MRFQIALTNVSFDQNYENVLRFETKEEQQKFFGVSTLFSNAINVNFTARNLLNTTAFFRLENGQNLKELLTKNYAIVKDTKTNDFLYYFINSISQDDDGQVHLRLALDVFQTFYLDTTFSDCVVERANLNRFIDNNDGTVSFDGNVDSKLFEREPLRDFSQRLTKRERVKLVDPFVEDEQVTKANQFINEDITVWVYVFLDPTHEFSFQSFLTGEKDFKTKIKPLVFQPKAESSTFGNIQNAISINLGVLCFPIGNDRRYSTVGAALWEIESFKNFINMNGYDYIYSIKISSIPPFNPSVKKLDGSLVSYYTVKDESSNERFMHLKIDSNAGGIYELDGTTRADCEFFATRSTGTGSDYGLLAVYHLAPNLLTNMTLDVDFDFKKDEIVGALKDLKFNPKLLSTDFKTVRLKAANSSDGFDYNLQKLNTNKLNIELISPIDAAVTTKYATLRTKGVYISDCADSFIGDVSQSEDSLNIATSAYQTMLANNKNYFLQNSINRWINAGVGAISSGVSIGMGVETGNLLGVAGGVLGAVRTTANFVKDSINEDLTVDNLKNAPGKLNVASGSAYLNFANDNVGSYVEIYDSLPNEKQIANDYMDAFGFTYNRIDNVKNVDNIRHFHNFVKANISEMTGVSNEIRQVFVEAFGRGVRFWNAKNITDKSNPFDYKMENYENWLAE